MIAVKIEMWPGGFEEHAYPLYSMVIANDMETFRETQGNKGSYIVYVGRKGWSMDKLRGKILHGEIQPSGRVENFPRKSRTVLELLRRALVAAAR